MYTGPNFRQGGVVLVFALLVLLMLGLLVTAVMRGNVLQLRMARNLEQSALERQLALSEIERILEHLGVDVPGGAPGFRHCTQGGTVGDCDASSLPAPSGGAQSVSAYVDVWRKGRPPRMVETRASSGIAYQGLRYEIGAVAGNTTLGQGVLVLFPEGKL